MTLVETLLGVAGLALLVLGGDWLVRGASRIASALGVPPLVVGLTVVAMGTSAPEAAVGVAAAAKGQADLALGNVVGSNTFNVLFILGLSALVAPLVVERRLVRVDVPLMVVAAASLALLGLDGRIGRGDGLLLVAGLATYVVFTVRNARAAAAPPVVSPADGGDTAPPPRRDARAMAWAAALVLAGLGALVLGSNWLVAAAVSLARSLGVSELVIGLTIVAVGTSLPEVATSVLATFRGERDIAVGNVVGSNLFNVLGVMGLSAACSPDGVRVPPTALEFDLPVMVGACLACLPVFFTGFRIARWEGALFLGHYGAYLAFLVLAATRHPGLDTFASAMAFFVIPMTVVTVSVLAVREIRRLRIEKSFPR